jgi:molecular chaperone GrpE
MEKGENYEKEMQLNENECNEGNKETSKLHKKESKVKKEDEKLLKIENEKKELYDKYLRLRADFDNYKKRSEKEKSDIYTRSLEEIFAKLLPIVDNFERALTSENEQTGAFVEGMRMVYSQLMELLSSEGLTIIEAENKAFDPQFHHAVITECNEEKDDNTVLMVLQNGYMLKDRIIRPAMVKVNKL